MIDDMKRLFAIVLLVLFSTFGKAQNKEFLSLQLGVGYYNYPNLKSDDVYFNYGLSPQLFLNIERFKIGSGVSFATKKYSYEYEITPINNIITDEWE